MWFGVSVRVKEIDFSHTLRGSSLKVKFSGVGFLREIEGSRVACGIFLECF